jgi:hypothetical protein
LSSFLYHRNLQHHLNAAAFLRLTSLRCRVRKQIDVSLLTFAARAVLQPCLRSISHKSGLLKLKLKLKLKLIYDRQSVGQSVLMSGAHLGPVTNFSFSLKFPLDSCGFVIL